MLAGSDAITHEVDSPTGWPGKVGWILRHWGHEPIGIAVPLVALAIVLLAPQMPDIFAGIVGWWRSLFFAVSVAFLGLSAWYWIRAALMARKEESDAQRHKRKSGDKRPQDLTAEEWSLEWAPRIALLLPGITALAPLLIALNSERSFRDVPFLAILLGAVFIVGLFILVYKRHDLNLYLNVPEPSWIRRVWRWRTTAVIAAAPFGWPVAIVLLILSGLSAGILATHHTWFDSLFPNWAGSWPAGPDYVFYAPTAALFTLGLIIPPLVMALALLRDFVHLLLGWLWQLGEWVRVHLLGGQQPSTNNQQHSLKLSETSLGKVSSFIGLVLLVGIFMFPLTGEAENRYKIRTISTEKAILDEPSGACDTGDGGTPSQNGLRRLCLREAVMAWHDAKVAAGHPKGRAMPMIIVAAEGGGSRAAVWMLSAMKLLDTKTNGDFGHYLFAISGVSGGSLGAVTYLQALRQYGMPGRGLNWDADAVNKGVNALAEGDLLTASIATFFLNDPLARLFGGVWNMDDRGIALEKTFERYWQSEAGLMIPAEQAKGGFVALREDRDPGLPHLLLNGTDADTGQRVITSTIRFHPDDDLFAASDDMLAILKEDVFASTAVTNSARFPYISPPGRFKEVLDHNTLLIKEREVLDGGYFENYGARTAAELSRKVREISDRDPDLDLKPIVIVISNDANAPRSPTDKIEEQTPITCPRFSVPIPPSDPATLEALEKRGRGIAGDWLAPLLGLYATRGAHGQDALHILRRDHCSADGLSDRMIHIAMPKPDPDKNEAAPLNWVLNKDAAKFLISDAPQIRFNQDQAQELNGILQALLTHPDPDGNGRAAR